MARCGLGSVSRHRHDECGTNRVHEFILAVCSRVAVGLAGGEGVAGLAAIIGYLVMNVTMGAVIGVTPSMIGTNYEYASVLGIPTLATGVFGGIIVGILAASMYRRFFKIELPSHLGFCRKTVCSDYDGRNLRFAWSVDGLYMASDPVCA